MHALSAIFSINAFFFSSSGKMIPWRIQKRTSTDSSVGFLVHPDFSRQGLLREWTDVVPHIGFYSAWQFRCMSSPPRSHPSIHHALSLLLCNLGKNLQWSLKKGTALTIADGGMLLFESLWVVCIIANECRCGGRTDVYLNPCKMSPGFILNLFSYGLLMKAIWCLCGANKYLILLAYLKKKQETTDKVVPQQKQTETMQGFINVSCPN